MSFQSRLCSALLIAGIICPAMSVEAQDAEAILRETFVRGAKENLDKGNYQEAERLLKAAQAEAQKYPRQFGPLLEILSTLESVYLRQGRLDEAETLAQKAYETALKTRGGDSLETADSLYNLAVIQSRKGKTSEATDSLKKALAAYEVTQNQSSLAAADTHWGLGALMFRQKDYSQAEESLKQALTIYDQVRGEESRDFVDGVTLLAVADLELEKYSLAEKLLLRALEINEKLAGKDSLSAAATLEFMGRLAQKQNQFTEAAKHLERAVGIVRKTAPAASHADPASRQDALERLKLAQSSGAKSYRNLDKISAEADAKPFEIMRDYASVLRKLDREPEAKKLDAEARVLEKKATAKRS